MSEIFYDEGYRLLKSCLPHTFQSLDYDDVENDLCLESESKKSYRVGGERRALFHSLTQSLIPVTQVDPTVPSKHLFSSQHLPNLKCSFSKFAP